MRRSIRAFLVVVVTLVLAGCYPRFDWRDTRPDCARAWCDFVATFPGKITVATRDVPVGAARLPLSLYVVSAGDTTFAVGAFDLAATRVDRDTDAAAAAAQSLLERKLLDDVGAETARRGTVVLHAVDRSQLPASTFVADGRRGEQRLHAEARFVRRKARLVEILVIGPANVLEKPSGRQAIETFLTSLRLD